MIKNKRLLLPAALAVASCLSSVALAQTTATWLSPTSGNWTDPTMWSTNPYYPTSGNPTGTTYDALIDATGMGTSYTIQATAPITLHSLTIDSPLATVDFQQLLTAGTINLDAGTLALSATSGATISKMTSSGSFSITAGSSTISNFSNSGTFSVSGATVTLSNFTSSTPVSFVNSNVSLDGTLDPSLIQKTGGTLSITGTLHNLGTINLDTLGGLYLSGTIDGGTITGSNSTLLSLGTGMGLSNVNFDLPSLSPNNATFSGNVTFSNTAISMTGTSLSVAAGTTLGGTAQLSLGNAAVSFGQNSVIGNGVTVIAGTTSTMSGNLNNGGTILIPTGSSLQLNLDSYSNTGSVQLSGGTLILGNSSAKVGVLPANIQQNFTRNGGQILLGGSYNFTGQTVDLTSTPLGPVDLSPISITGGTLVAPGRTLNFYEAPGGSTTELAGVTLASNVKMQGSALGWLDLGANGLTLKNATLDLDKTTLYLYQNTLGGTGAVVFDPAPTDAPVSTLSHAIIGPGITVVAGAGNGQIGDAWSLPNLTTNNGTISSGANGNWVAITGTGFVNNGGVEAVNGGSISLQFPFTNNGSISADNGTLAFYGTIDWNAITGMSFNNANLMISGSLDNTGKTLAVKENGRSLQVAISGNITGGTIAAPNGGVLTFLFGMFPNDGPQYSGPNLSNLTLAAPANVITGGLAKFSGVDVEAPVTVNGGTLSLSGTTVVNQPITTIGGTIVLSSVSNLSSINATQNSTVRIGSWSQNLGNLTLTDSVLQIPGTGNTAALIESISRTNSPVLLNNMDLTGQTLTLDRAPAWYLAESTITAGEIIASQSTPLAVGLPNGGSDSGTLNGVTVRGPINIGWQDLLTVENSLTLDDGQIVLISAGDGVTPAHPAGLATASFGNSQSVLLSGNGQVIFDNDPSHSATASALLGGTSGKTLVIGSGITIQNGNGNGIITDTVISNGTVSASVANTSISIMPIFRYTGASFQNNGILMAVNGGTLNVVENSLTNFSAGTLTNGTYDVFDNSTINFTNSSISAAITTNNANVLLSGPNSHFDAINALSANLGHFSLLGGREFTTAGDLANTGTVSVDDRSLLTVTGGLSLGDTSVLDMTLGAGHGTLIDVQGSANLDGQLQIELANGFVPASGDQFAFMTAGTFDGNFTSFDLPTLPGSEAWDTSQASAGILSVTPEPSMLTIVGLLSASLLLRRRRSGTF